LTWRSNIEKMLKCLPKQPNWPQAIGN
jgi:hypothetical protein